MPKSPRLLDKVYMGIDPGANGGIATISSGIVQSCRIPDSDMDLLQFMRLHEGVETFAVLEKVGGFIGRGGKGVAVGPTMFKFGRGYGALRMALTAAGIPFEEVTPQVWQRGLGIPHKTKKETSTQWKNRLKAKAQQLFPKVQVTLAIADALLIAEFCRRKHTGRL